MVLGGCLQTGAHFDFGLGTTEIHGNLTLEGKPLPAGQAVALVFQEEHLFVSVGPEGVPGDPSRRDTEKQLTYRTVRLAHISPEGRWWLPMPDHVLEVRVMFMLPGCATEEFRFRRQLGVGDVTFDVDMKPLPEWRDHFYTYIQPVVQNVLADSRYRMSPQDMQGLDGWLRGYAKKQADASPRQER